jgi:transcriptional regulator with XRE-family HTH domain
MNSFAALSSPPVDNSSQNLIFANWKAVMSVKELRRERSWSQEKLAELSGLSLRTIQRIESSGKAGYGSLRALAIAFEIDDSALELELAMSKSSNGWKKRPAWVRALFLGSGRVQMDSHQHILVEKFAVTAGIMFVSFGVFGTNGALAGESAKVPMLLCGSLMFLAAYLMSLIVRIGNRHAVWPWVEAPED